MFRRGLCTLWLLLACVAAAGGDDKSSDERDAASYLTGKGHLAQTLTLRDSQGGFAGFSGSLWTIEPDGTWRRAPFLNEDVREAEQSGQLSAKELSALAAALKQHKLVDLPKNIGGEPMTNPHVFTLTFGKFSCELVLGAGADLPDPEDKEQSEEARRFAAMVIAVRELLNETSEERE